VTEIFEIFLNNDFFGIYTPFNTFLKLHSISN
jgi:hypothetical protein